MAPAPRPTVVTFPGKVKLLEAPKGATATPLYGPHGLRGTRVTVPPGLRADYELKDQPLRKHGPLKPTAHVKFVKDEPAHVHAELEHGTGEDGAPRVTARSTTHEGFSGTAATAAEAVAALKAEIGKRDVKPENGDKPAEPEPLETRHG